MKNICIILFLIAFQATNAQVLWSDDFDSYNTGALSTDLTGSTAGQGGWYVETYNINFNIQPEAGRGNVMAIGWANWINVGSMHIKAFQKDIDKLWNNRNKTNNIFKLEYDMYVSNYPSTYNGSFRVDNYLRGNTIPFISEMHCFVNKGGGHNLFSGPIGESWSISVSYTPSWIKVEMYIDYNTNNLYYYIPNLYYKKDINKKVEVPNSFSVGSYVMGAIVYPNYLIKYDNIKILAISTLPNYLNVDEFLSSKFNLFPNPANDIVTITSNENIGIEQIEIYDVSGKNVKFQKYNNENEIQLNISDLASGTYMFHIKTNQGKAIKKMVKK